MAADHPSFAGLNYAKLAEVEPQWPIVGRNDMYYGGTTYANKHGLGVQLSNTAQRGEKISLPRIQKTTTLRPNDKKLLAIPITKLYDHGVTVSTSGLLDDRSGEAYVALNPGTAEKLGVIPGQHVTLKLDGASEVVIVKVNDSISTGVALVPRSMGLPISGPMEVSLKATRKAAVR
jgi:NADH-quinone oxidoreductase subunit G